MLFSPNSSSCPNKLSLEYQLYAPKGQLLRGACGNFLGYSSILEKIAILGQPSRKMRLYEKSWNKACFKFNHYGLKVHSFTIRCALRIYFCASPKAPLFYNLR